MKNKSVYHHHHHFTINPTTMTNLATQDFFSREEVTSEFKKLLWANSASYITTILSIVKDNSMLKDADPQTIYNAALTAAWMKLPINPNLGFAYIIPYKNNKTKIISAQFQMWYKWYKQLALRSKEFRLIHATDVREWEIVSHNRLTGELIFEWLESDLRKTKKVIWYVSYFELLSWFTSTLYMTSKELDAHGIRYSQSYRNWNWKRKDDFESMCLKTVTKLNLSRNAPLSIETSTELRNAIIADQWVIDWDDNTQYPDNPDVNPKITNTIDEELLDKRKKDLAECATLEEVTALFKQNKPTDPTILSLFTARKNELSNIQN